MKPRRTVRSNNVFRLTGGTEDNDLWVRRDTEQGDPVIHSVWELTAAEREAIAGGQNIQLTVWGDGHPPVAMRTTDAVLGRNKSGAKP